MGRIRINYIKKNIVQQQLCDNDLLDSITVQRPTDTPNTGWNNDLLGTGNLLTGNLKFNFEIGVSTPNTPQMIGINSDLATNESYQSIDYAVYLYESGATRLLRVYENGSFKNSYAAGWNNGDKICIQRTAGVIEYLINGVVFYTSTVPSTADLGVDSSFYYVGGFWGTGSITLNNISLCQI